MIDIPFHRCFNMIQFEPGKPIELGSEFLCTGCQTRERWIVRNKRISKLIKKTWWQKLKSLYGTN